MKDAATQKGSTQAAGTQAIARASALLREIAAANEPGARMADLADKLGLERPTVHRILRRLVDESFVEQDPASRTYRLGRLVYELGLVAKPPVALQAACEASLEGLAEVSADTAFAFVQSSHDTVCLGRRTGAYPVKAMLLEVGGRRPMGTGAGSLALLSAMPPEQAARMLDANERRLLALGEERALLDKTIEEGREVGCTFKHPVGMPEILSMAVPVLDAFRKPVLALSISALTPRILRRTAELQALLKRESAAVARRLRAAQAG